MVAKSKISKILIGTSGWIYPAWRGHFYPKKLASKNWFEYYQQYFRIVEINATFYRSFDKKVYLKWKNQADPKFKYVIKVHRYITHRKKLIDCKDSIKRFCKSVRILKDKLGFILLQLPPSIAYDPPRLKKAIKYFDDPTKVVVEFRDAKWYTTEVKNILTELGCTFCAIDSPEMRLQDWVTSQSAYIRLHGRKRWYNYNYSEKDLLDVKRFVRKMARKGAKKIYVLFNNDYYAYACSNAITLMKMLRL